MTEQNSHIKKIVWAIDPFDSDQKVSRLVARAIFGFVKNRPIAVIPVYLEYIPQSRFAKPPNLASIQEQGEKRLRQTLRRITFKKIMPLKVLTVPRPSLGASVETLVSFARKIKADLVATGSHARKGLNRWLLGSFAETLIFRAEMPFLVVNPHWVRAPKFEHVVFATDFSQQSEEAFFKCLKWARLLGAKVTLFHKIQVIPTYSAEFSWTAYPQYQQVLDEAKATAENEARSWVSRAKRMGLQVRVVIDAQTAGTVARSIIEFAKGNPGLIALSANSSALRSVWLGSVARQVVRESPHPVWVLRPGSQKKSLGQVSRDLEPLLSA